MKLWDVSYIKGGESGAFEFGYQGRSRILAWFWVGYLRAKGNEVRVMVKDGSAPFTNYAYYFPYNFGAP